MRKKGKVILIVLLVVFLSLSTGLYYFAKNVLPTLLREKITTEISSITSSEVTLDKISFSLLRGAVLENLIIFDKDDPKKELCSVKEASATFLILPFFKEKKIIVPRVVLAGIIVNIIRQKDDSLNITYLMDKLKQPQGSGKTPAILIRALSISDSTVLFTDNSFQAPMAVKLDIRNLLSKISFNKITLEASLRLTKLDKMTDLEINTVYLFAQHKMDGNFVIKDIDVRTYEAYLKEYLKAIPVTLETAQLTRCQTDFSVDLKKMLYQGKATFDGVFLSIKEPISVDAKLGRSSCDFAINDKTARLSVHVDLNNLNAQKDNIRLTGLNAQGDVDIQIPLQKAENLQSTYAGLIAIKNGELSGLGTIDKISEIKSNLKFKNADFSIEDITAKILDTPISAKANLKNKTLAIDLSGHFDIPKLLALIPKNIELPAYEISGTADLTAHIVSDLSAQNIPSVAGKANLQHIALNLPQNQLALATDKGIVTFDLLGQNVQWHFEDIRYLAENYSFDGNLKNFETPVVHAMVIGKDIKAQADFTKKAELLDISSFKGRYKNSEVDLKGQYDLGENISFGGLIILDFADLKNLLPQAKDMLEKIGLEGRCLITTEASGPIKDYRLWNIKTKGKSSAVKIYGLKTENIIFQYAQIDKTGFLNNLSFDAYNGKGSVNGRVNLADSNITYTLSGILQDIDLNVAKRDTPLKDKTFYGTLGLNIYLAGQGNDPKELKGNCSFAVKNGNLWEFNPLQGLGSFIFLPRFSHIVFTNAQGDFMIQDGYIATDNLELLGPDLGLIAEGKVTLDGQLDLLVNSQILQPGPKQPQEGAIAQALEEKGKIMEVISKVGSLTAIKVTGTVKEPKYRVQPIAENIIKKISDIFSNIVP